jgi:lysyl-tRNA synthetase class 2
MASGVYDAAMPSGVIRDSDYDAARHELTVRFTNGRVYIYSLVPAAVAAALAGAPSKGVYFNTHVRDRFPFRKVVALVATEKRTRATLMDALRASRDEI